MVTKTSAQVGSFGSSGLGFDSREARFPNFSFNELSIKEGDIQLSSKQISKITKIVDVNLQTRRAIQTQTGKYISEVTKDECLFREIEDKKRKEFLKVQTLLEIGAVELDIIRNTFPKVEFNLEFYESELNKDIKKEHNFQLKVQGYSTIKYKNLSKKDLSGYLWRLGADSWKEYKKLQKDLLYLNNNSLWAEAYLSEFKETKKIVNLQTSVNLLKSINNKKIVRKAVSGFSDSNITYFSRNRFCAPSQEFKTIQNEKQILETLDYWDKKGYTADFLTYAPKNIADLTKEDMLSFSDILKEIMRDDFLSSIFKGHYGFIEIKEKDNLVFNVHIHLIVLRKKAKFNERLKYKISETFERVSNKFGNFKLKGSKIIDYQEISTIVKGDNVYKGAVRYIHQYITKGIDVNSLAGRKVVIKATDGVRFLRSGGLLSLTQQKNIATENIVSESISQRVESEKSTNMSKYPLLLGGTDSSDSLEYSLYEFDKLFGFSSDQILKKIKSDSGFWKDLKKSIFCSEKQFCPFSKKPLLFCKTGTWNATTDYRESLFIFDALQSLGLKQESQNFGDCIGLPRDMNVIYRNDSFDELPENIRLEALGL